MLLQNVKVMPMSASVTIIVLLISGFLAMIYYDAAQMNCKMQKKQRHQVEQQQKEIDSKIRNIHKLDFYFKDI